LLAGYGKAGVAGRARRAGPRVAGATWNREVSLVNQFYRWATRRGYVAENPV
jgi:hypothetical protein